MSIIRNPPPQNKGDLLGPAMSRRTFLGGLAGAAGIEAVKPAVLGLALIGETGIALYNSVQYEERVLNFASGSSGGWANASLGAWATNWAAPKGVYARQAAYAYVEHLGNGRFKVTLKLAMEKNGSETLNYNCTISVYADGSEVAHWGANYTVWYGWDSPTPREAVFYVTLPGAYPYSEVHITSYQWGYVPTTGVTGSTGESVYDFYIRRYSSTITSDLTKHFWGEVASPGMTNDAPWYGRYRIYAVIGGNKRYLDIFRRLQPNGEKVVAYSDNKPNVCQIWTVSYSYSGSKRMALTSAGNQIKKLACDDSNGASGTNAVIWDAAGEAWALWQPIYANKTHNGNRGYYLRTCTGSGCNLAIFGSSTADNAQVGLYTHVETLADQIWYFEPTDTGFNAIQSKVTQWKSDAISTGDRPPSEASKCRYTFYNDAACTSFVGTIGPGSNMVNLPPYTNYWFKETSAPDSLKLDDTVYCFYGDDGDKGVDVANWPDKFSLAPQKLAPSRAEPDASAADASPELALPSPRVGKVGTKSLAARSRIYALCAGRWRAMSPDAWYASAAAEGAAMRSVDLSMDKTVYVRWLWDTADGVVDRRG